MANAIYISGNDNAFKTIQNEQKHKNIYKLVLVLSVIIMALGAILALSLFSSEKNAVLNTVIKVVDEQGNEVLRPYFTNLSKDQLSKIVMTRINTELYVSMIVIAVCGAISTAVFATLTTLKQKQLHGLISKIID